MADVARPGDPEFEPNSYQEEVAHFRAQGRPADAEIIAGVKWGQYPTGDVIDLADDPS